MQGVATGIRAADAQGGRFLENNPRQPVGVLDSGEHREDVGRTVFLHLRGLGDDVEGARRHQAFDGVAEGFAAVVVDVGFQHGDRFAQPRAGRAGFADH